MSDSSNHCVNRHNQRTRADLADGSYWVYEYDKLGQVISGRRYWGDGTLMAGQDFTYQFDDIGNRDTTGGRASAISDYSANQLNQYETRTVPNKLDILGVANPTQPVEVWKESDSPSTASRSGEYFHYALTVAYSSYPEVFAKSLFAPNQQASAGRSFVPPAIEDFDHDLDGNLIKDGRWTAYVWDGENRLIEMKRDTGSPLLAQQRLTFEYDHLGRRVRKRYFTWSGSNWAEQRVTTYLYDGWNLVAELDGNNANATLRTYVWGTDLSGNRSGAGGVGGLLWVNNSQTTGGLPTGIQFVAYDGNGNVSGLTSATDGSNTARYEYGPFGEPLRTTGPLAAANPIRWSTKVTDDETGLVYYGYRYYSSMSGRWLGRDPIEEEGGINLVMFVLNTPISHIDPVGKNGYTMVLKFCNGFGADTTCYGPDDSETKDLSRGMVAKLNRNSILSKLAAQCRTGSSKSAIRFEIKLGLQDISPKMYPYKFVAALFNNSTDAAIGSWAIEGGRSHVVATAVDCCFCKAVLHWHVENDMTMTSGGHKMPKRNPDGSITYGGDHSIFEGWNNPFGNSGGDDPTGLWYDPLRNRTQVFFWQEEVFFGPCH